MYFHDALRQVSGVHTACTKVVVHLIPPLQAHTLVNLQPLLSCMLGATHCCNQVREEVCAAHCNQRGVSLQVSQAHHTVLCDLYPSRQQASQKCLSTDVIPAPALHRRTSEGQPRACTSLGSPAVKGARSIGLILALMWTYLCMLFVAWESHPWNGVVSNVHNKPVVNMLIGLR